LSEFRATALDQHDRAGGGRCRVPVADRVAVLRRVQPGADCLEGERAAARQHVVCRLDRTRGQHREQLLAYVTQLLGSGLQALDRYQGTAIDRLEKRQQVVQPAKRARGERDVLARVLGEGD
jgi:hypothetical protein